MTELRVQHRSGDCRVVIGHGSFAETPRFIKETAIGGCAGHCAVITDGNVARHYLEPLLERLRSSGMQPTAVIVPSGEASKSMQSAAEVVDQLAWARLDRHGFIIALGGGVVGDLAGFVAAIYYRGVPCVQIPTTVIAQCDSAIGGKTGVNTASAKNLIGAFHPPRLVVVDPDLLQTLPAREYNEGFAEAIKHGIVRDPELFEELTHLNNQNLADIIHRNLEIKTGLVNADEFERNGQRALLNFGHTIGHGIEQAAGYGRFLHGEAISLGIVAASRISQRKVGLPADQLEAIIHCLRQFHLPVILPEDLSTGTILASLALDKKFEGGKIRFVLTPAIGTALLSTGDQVTIQDLREAVEDLRA